ncbi:uncharacterized protein LOC132264197 isoform X1 [Phlebotomus argentipes]|uniref:uncharacterized protein LOC132264197 isoform X1 n=1 Tax=Phlebotomus argentipes TaxID=94469 RepID=UPI002892FAB0|nr:uncharacterized protein LOC132264197 isoform X1 [Phlebotomus argentipes]
MLVVHWSIFTLTLQLTYSASIHSHVDSAPTAAESICSELPETSLQEDGVESSLTLELKPHMIRGSCKRIFLAPESHGFFVRLHRPATGKKFTFTNKNLSSGLKMRTTNSTTESCPLTIFFSNDARIPPWRIDPCQLEANGGVDEPVRLLQGRLRIVWQHGGNMPNYRLLLTAFGKGELCKQERKHPCLRVGHETLFCISEDLICDGVQHCPSGNEYDSDESAELCSGSQKSPLVPKMQLWEHFSMQMFRELFSPDLTSTSTTVLPPLVTSEPTLAPTSTRKSLTRGLSRYGPWGYLMLGMLLCGGALLICGLWECCCRQTKPTTPGSGSGDGHTGESFADSPASGSTQSDLTPPNYDEIEPPPSYSTLFPGFKGTNSEVTSTTDSNSPVAAPTPV